MKKQTLKLPRSNEYRKAPSSSQMQFGELYINYASGAGNSFLTTKKSDGEIAMFSEDDAYSSTLEIRGGGA